MAKFKGNAVNLNAAALKVGDDAPSVELVNTGLEQVQIGGKKDKPQLLLAVPSLDTGVCATETKAFNEKIADIGIEAYVISMDLPFASGRFCSTEGISTLKALSDFRAKEFSTKYSALITDSALQGLSTRAVFVVDTNGKLSYVEMVEEITDEPNYDKALEALNNAL